MDNKLEIFNRQLPKAVLIAMTLEAKEAVPHTLLQEDYIVIKDFPYRIGRESRVVKISGRFDRIEREKKAGSAPNNDLYLLDRGKLLNISREHVQIEKREDGYYLVDRGSAAGTKLAGKNIGGRDAGGAASLKDGDVFALGAKSSPYVYKFISFDEFEVIKR